MATEGRQTRDRQQTDDTHTHRQTDEKGMQVALDRYDRLARDRSRGTYEWGWELG